MYAMKTDYQKMIILCNFLPVIIGILNLVVVLYNIYVHRLTESFILSRNMRDRINDFSSSSGMTTRSAYETTSSSDPENFLTPELKYLLEEMSNSRLSTQVCFQTYMFCQTEFS